MSHTKEPWIIVPGGRLDPEVIITTQHRLDGRKAEICGMDVEFTGHHGDEQKANTRRIVACVNACAGIETHELELMTGRMSIASQIKACDAIYATAEAKATRRSKFARQRDELLAAAEAIEINAEECMGFDDCTAMLVPIDDYHKLMDAIATAKGATP